MLLIVRSYGKILYLHLLNHKALNKDWTWKWIVHKFKVNGYKEDDAQWFSSWPLYMIKLKLKPSKHHCRLACFFHPQRTKSISIATLKFLQHLFFNYYDLSSLTIMTHLRMINRTFKSSSDC